MRDSERSRNFSVRVGNRDIRFSSAHFTVFGDKREPLHGHNYEVSLEIAGLLTEDGYVIDFAEAKAILRDICGSLDHKMIVPTGHPALTVERREGSVEVSLREETFRFPAEDVLLLPILNATAELFAEHICRFVVEVLLSRGRGNITEVCVSVEEAGGQVAICRESMGGSSERSAGG